MVVSGFATGDRVLPPSLALRLGAVNAEGLVGIEGGSVGDVSLGRTTTIIKPISVPTAAPVSRAARVYTAASGDNVAALAARFGVSEESIRWSNFGSLSQLEQDVSAGESLIIPPVNGVAVQIAAGDTAASLAARYHADPQTVIDYNYLRDPDHLTPGDVLVIPGGTGPELVKPAPPPLRVAAAAPRPSGGSTDAVATGGPAPGGAGGNRFDYGYCTWYVASRRPVPWLGNAWQWYGQAQAYGWATGKTPRAGAIMVTWESGWGHVAIVERVNPDGSWLVSEMNFVAWGVVDQRTVKPGAVPVIGFIY
jgi:LysM repeat protein